MAYPTISTLPTAPQRLSSPDTFVTDADAFLGALGPWRDDVNTAGTYIEGRANDAQTYSVNAANSATASANYATDSSNYANVSLGHANDAEAFKDSAEVAAAAAQAAAGLPSLTGNAGKSLSVNDTEDGVLWKGTGSTELSLSRQNISGTSNVDLTSVSVFELTVTGDATVGVTTIPTNYRVSGEILVDNTAGYDVNVSNIVINDEENFKGFLSPFAASEIYDSFDISPQTIAPRVIAIADNDSKLYVSDSTSGEIFQYNMSSDDLKTVSYSGNSYDDIPINDIFMKPDGTEYYIANTTGNYIFNRTLSTSFDISTASLGTNSPPLGLTANTFCMSSNGLKMFAYNGSTRVLHQFSMSPAWDITSITPDGVTYDMSSLGLIYSIRISSDGLEMFAGAASNHIYRFRLNSSNNISSVTLVDDLVTTIANLSVNVDPRYLCLSDSERSVYVASNSTDTIEQLRFKDVSTVLKCNQKYDVVYADWEYINI